MIEVIEKLDYYGRGICHVDGKICFVLDALPGEKVEIEIVKEKKKYLEARVIKYLEKTSTRSTRVCPYGKVCGGCDLDHLSDEEEIAFKSLKVKELLSRNLNINDNIFKDIVSGSTNNYRNKIIFHIDSKELGLYEKHSNKLVSISNCNLVDKKINDLIPYLLKVTRKNKISEVMVRVGNETKEVMLSIKGDDIDDYGILLDKVDVLFINDKCLSKKSQITSVIGKYNFLVSKDVFFQVNQYLTKSLYDEVLSNIIKYKSKNVLDLYCGTGTIGIYISEYVDKVLGIEVNKMAIEDAKSNKKLNNIKNIHFLNGKVEDLIDSIKGNFDTIIVDPPRAGLDSRVIDNIINIRSKILIYVSCDLFTLCRDLKILEKFYKVQYIRAFNMFPRTYHVECVCVLIIK